jgi:hypothetical protein
VTNIIESVPKVALKTCYSTSKSITDDQQQEEELTQIVRTLPSAHNQRRTREIYEAKNYSR